MTESSPATAGRRSPRSWPPPPRAWRSWTRLGAGEDSERDVRERDSALLGHQPRVLHVEARLLVSGDRVGMHGDDHVRAQLRFVALADPGVLDHRHADRVAGDV